VSGAPDMRTDHSRNAAMGLAIGVYAALVLAMAFWLLAGTMWFPIAHFLVMEGVWIGSWRVCARNGERAMARGLLVGGALVTVVAIFALLGVFIRVYN